MASTRNRGKLAYKILFWFLLISLAPDGIFVGWHLVNITQESLRKETLAMQESLAVGFSDTAYKYVTTFSQRSDRDGRPRGLRLHEPRQAAAVSEPHPAGPLRGFGAVGAERSGVEALRIGRFLGPNPDMRDFGGGSLFRRDGTREASSSAHLERFQGLYPTVTISVPIMDQSVQPARPVGVVAAQV